MTADIITYPSRLSRGSQPYIPRATRPEPEGHNRVLYSFWLESAHWLICSPLIMGFGLLIRCKALLYYQIIWPVINRVDLVNVFSPVNEKWYHTFHFHNFLHVINFKWPGTIFISMNGFCSNKSSNNDKTSYIKIY